MSRMNKQRSYTGRSSHDRADAARMASLGEDVVRAVMTETGVGARKACAAIERQRGLRWQQAGQLHVSGSHD